MRESLPQLLNLLSNAACTSGGSPITATRRTMRCMLLPFFWSKLPAVAARELERALSSSVDGRLKARGVLLVATALATLFFSSSKRTLFKKRVFSNAAFTSGGSKIRTMRIHF